jgi:hypothetical protein
VRDSAELVDPVVKALWASYPCWLPGDQIKVLDDIILTVRPFRNAVRRIAPNMAKKAPLPHPERTKIVHSHSLPCAEWAGSADQLARLYGKRWSIETAFFEITTTLSCEINTLGYPTAALLTFSRALLAYNAVSLIKAAWRSEKGRKTVNDEVSSYYLSLEIGRIYDGMMRAIPVPHGRYFETSWTRNSPTRCGS